MSKVRFALIGAGNIGSRHLAVINSDPRSELVGICDVEIDRCEKYSALYGNIPYFTNYRELLKQSTADVVSICTPHGLHAQMAIETAQAQKHILVEKPMALSVEDCHKMIDAASKANVTLMVVKQNRYNVPIALTRDAILKGRLGKILMVQCNVLWNRPQSYYGESNWRGKVKFEGGVLHTQVSHFIDLMIWWFGDIANAQVHLETKTHKIEIEDCGVAMLQFQSGVLGSLTWTTCVYNKNYEGSITVIGENGTVKIGGQYLNKIEYWDVQSYPLPEDVQFVDVPNEYTGKYQGTASNHDKVISDVVSKLLHERHNVVEGDEGIKTIRAIEMIYQKAGIQL